MARFRPEIGSKVGMFIVIRGSDIRIHNRPTWVLECVCGGTILKTTSDLNKIVPTSNCGCIGIHRSVYALKAGDKFGKLTVIEPAGSNTHSKQMWLCKCDCGNTCIKITSSLKKAKMASCGCYVPIIHGKSHSQIYSVWGGMLERCNNKNSDYYDYYGGRGISVCEEWRDFANFAEDMGEIPTGYVIDRIDPCGNYNKENCRWVTRSESSYNTRKQKNNTSGRTGVVLDNRSNIWYARIDYQGKSIHLGSSYTFEGACKLREDAELLYFGYTKD